MALSELFAVYTRIKPAIIAKFREFNNNFKDKHAMKKELVFCLLTPQSKAEVCWNAVENIFSSSGCDDHDVKKIRDLLAGVRFRNNKAVYVSSACRNFDNIYLHIMNFKEDSKQLRRWLVKNIKGMGCKEASHFLRNIGLGQELAILDRHVLYLLRKYRVINDVPKSMSCKKYEEIESKMKIFSKEAGIPLHHLDLVLWMIKTQRIFK